MCFKSTSSCIIVLLFPVLAAERPATSSPANVSERPSCVQGYSRQFLPNISDKVQRLLAYNLYEQILITVMRPVRESNDKGECCYKNMDEPVGNCSYKIAYQLELLRSSAFRMLRCDILYQFTIPWSIDLHSQFKEVSWYSPNFIDAQFDRTKVNRISLIGAVKFAIKKANNFDFIIVYYGNTIHFVFHFYPENAFVLIFIFLSLSSLWLVWRYSDDIIYLEPPSFLRNRKLLIVSIFLFPYQVVCMATGCYIQWLKENNKLFTSYPRLCSIVASGVFIVVVMIISTITLAIKYIKLRRQYLFFFKLVTVILVLEFLSFYGCFLVLGTLSWPLVVLFGVFLTLFPFFSYFVGTVYALLLLIAIVFNLLLKCFNFRECTKVQKYLIEAILSFLVTLFSLGMNLILKSFQGTLFYYAADDFSNLITFSNGLILAVAGTISVGLLKWLKSKFDKDSLKENSTDEEMKKVPYESI